LTVEPRQNAGTGSPDSCHCGLPTCISAYCF